MEPLDSLGEKVTEDADAIAQYIYGDDDPEVNPVNDQQSSHPRHISGYIPPPPRRGDSDSSDSETRRRRCPVCYNRVRCYCTRPCDSDPDPPMDSQWPNRTANKDDKANLRISQHPRADTDDPGPSSPYRAKRKSGAHPGEQLLRSIGARLLQCDICGEWAYGMRCNHAKATQIPPVDGNDNVSVPPEVICINNETETRGAPLNHARTMERPRGRQWVMGRMGKMGRPTQRPRRNLYNSHKPIP